MKILHINGGSKGSTGKIIKGIKACAEEREITVECFSPVTTTNRHDEDDGFKRIGSHYGRLLSELLARVTGLSGCFSFFSTVKFLRYVRDFNPDILHLHTLHSSYINIPMLFRYIKKHNIPVVWTLHDCWAFTGHCPHFEMYGCEKWQSECYNCSQYKDYPKSFVDSSRRMYRLKKRWFRGVKELTVVVPSKWLADLVEKSFLSEYPIRIINNGIDLKVFRPSDSDFRQKYNCDGKSIILGVAFGWGEKKGLDVFLELAESLDKNKYQIVLVGTEASIDKLLPANIISVNRTENQKQLAEIYSAADVLVNPTREDTFPTVNIEALACGTPVITFRTGGSPEIIDETCGAVIAKDDVESLKTTISAVIDNKEYSADCCMKRAELFSDEQKFSEYIELYEELIGDRASKD